MVFMLFTSIFISFIPAEIPAGTKPDCYIFYQYLTICFFTISEDIGLLVGSVLGVNSPSYFIRYHIHRHKAIALGVMRDMPHLRFCQSDDILALK